jgi:4-amino-4-deoxy-L-arabinose transferase-like glycosyltransferase
MELVIAGIPMAAVIVALVELMKAQGLPSRYAAPVAVGLGVLFAVCAKVAAGNPEFASWVEAILVGILAGLSASGLYSGTRAVRGD